MGHYVAPEVWKPIPEWEGLYEVSDHGRVRSLPRTVIHRNGKRYPVPERILTWRVGSTGYPQVSLSRDKVIRQVAVHILVLEAFVGPRPEGYRACHWDDDKANNHVSNLRWGTNSDNAQDAIRNGRNHNLNKKECVNGHEFTTENTYLHGNWRYCKACFSDRAKARKTKVI